MNAGHLRPAEPTHTDAQAFAALYEAATLGMMRHYLGPQAYVILAGLFPQLRHEHSSEVTTFIEVDGQPVGLLMGYSAALHEAIGTRTLMLYGRFGAWGLLRSLPTIMRLRALRAVTGQLPHDAYYVKGLAVHPVHRRQGIGQTLLAYAEAQAREADCRRMVLDVRTHNAAALALYQACSYKITAKTPSVHVNDEEISFFRMEKGL